MGCWVGLVAGVFHVQSAHTVPMSLVIGELQLQSRQVGVVALWVFSFCGASRVPSHDFRVKT
jgi:hypothetical protein